MTLARRLFFWGSAVLALTGVAHFIGQFAARDAGGRAIAELMKAYHPEGASFSQWDIQECFGSCFGFLLMWAGASGVMFAGLFGETAARLRTAALFYAVAAAGVAAAAAIYGILPPIIVMSPALLLFLAAFFAAPRHVH